MTSRQAMSRVNHHRATRRKIQNGWHQPNSVPRMTTSSIKPWIF